MQYLNNNGGAIEKISISEPYDLKFEFDSIFEKIDIIRLETNAECLLGEVTKILFTGYYIFVHEFFGNNLYLFSIDGKFLRKIGRQGRGPGEYLSCRDFDVDDKLNIYILDFQRIKRYSIKGQWLEDYKLPGKNPEDPIYSNPLQFALCGSRDFYIWGGSFDRSKVKKPGTGFALYRIDRESAIKGGCFTLKYEMNETPNRFTRFNDSYNLVMLRGNDTVYKVDSVGITRKYFIDFGENRLQIPDNKAENKLINVKELITDQNSYQVEPFIETDAWIYFRFINSNKFYKVYYNKISKKTFVSRLSDRPKNILMPYDIKSEFSGRMVSVMEPSRIIEFYSKFNSEDFHSHNQKDMHEKLRDVKVTDNPVLFICSLRK